MKTIDKATIEQYRADRRSIWVWVMIFAPLLSVGMAVCNLADRKVISDTWWPWGFLAAGIGMVIFLFGGANMAYDQAHTEREEGWQYKLLDRWKLYSGRPLSMFPNSNIGSKFLERWAIEELSERAEELNQRYSREEVFYREERSIDWDNFSPRDGTLLKESRIRREEYMKRHIQEAKRSFLDFWDLVTEKNGIGILTGAEWQDPEAFRQKILARGFTYTRIGLLAY